MGEINLKIKKIGNRGTLFSFDDIGIPTNVYVINGKNFIYIIDTYLGPDIMDKINKYIEESYDKKPIIVVNTHSHWDHVWGNCLYASSLIIAHEKCKQYMQEDGAEALEKYKKHQKGKVTITYPNLTLIDRICFEEDNIQVYYTPGHTDDGISVLDMEDKVLFAGDNLERPIPYIMSKDLNQYIRTLESYLNVDVDIIIGGHTDCEDKGIVRDNLNYIKKIISGENIEIISEEFEAYHKANIKWLNQ